MECLGEIKMEEIMMISNTTHSLSPTSKPWKLYQNPLFSHNDPSISNCTHILPTLYSSHSQPSNLTFTIKTTLTSMKIELEDSRSQIKHLKSELDFERKLRKKMELLTKKMGKDLEEQKKGREVAERVCDELDIQVLGHDAEIGRIRSEIDEEKKMMRIAEVFREGRVQIKPEENKRCNYKERVSSLSPSSSSENPHIKRGIKGSVEFQRAVKATYSNNKSSKQIGDNGNHKLEYQKAQFKILLKQRTHVIS